MLAVALLNIFLVFGFDACDPGEIKSLNREIAELKDRLIREQRIAPRGVLTEDAIELRADIREKQDDLREERAKCVAVADDEERPLK